MLSDLDIEIAKAFCKYYTTYHDPDRSIPLLAKLYKKHPQDDALRKAVLPYIQSVIEEFRNSPSPLGGALLKTKLIKSGKIPMPNMPRATALQLGQAIRDAHIPFSVELMNFMVDNFTRDVRNRANTL